MKFVLASKSPRRKELLGKITDCFEIITAETDESLPAGTPPKKGVEVLAVRKGAAVAELLKTQKGYRDAVIVSSDTLVELDGKPLGKPKNEEDAFRMLTALGGRSHYVRTGVAIHYRGRAVSGVASAKVTFKPLSPEEIRAYIATGEPMDKAGSYGIQGEGRKLVAGYEGDFDTIMGLSLRLTKRLIRQITEPKKLPKPAKKHTDTDIDEKKMRLSEVNRRLTEKYPEAVCALHYDGDPWRLLVMGRLSAQCTDARVNLVCEDLFRLFPTAESMAYADVSAIEEIVRPCGLYHTKAQNLKDASRMLTEEYGGNLPADMDELLRFPGVGRKIANLLIGDIFAGDAVVCDTHCIRICGRLGMYDESLKDPDKAEEILRGILEKGSGSDFCHRIVLFGREVCMARNPDCPHCPLADLCPHGRKEKA